MPTILRLSRQRRNRRGELTECPLYFSDGDEYNQPTGAVIDVGRAFTVELNEFGRQLLVLAGEGFGQFLRFAPDRALHGAANGWYGMVLIFDECAEPVEIIE